MKIYDSKNRELDIKVTYGKFPEYNVSEIKIGGRTFVSDYQESPEFRFKIKKDCDHGILEAIHLENFINETFYPSCRDSSNIFSDYIRLQFIKDNYETIYQDYTFKKDSKEYVIEKARIANNKDEYHLIFKNFIIKS